ncbi:MAG: dihydropteroate synthase, partial [Kiritimatiellae bacterium]|nr:dihydropteroate synthase [Kiritimatiellia bacterium]
PGAVPVAWEVEWERIEPVLRELSPFCAERGVAVSVDTYHPETAERAVALGVSMINCVYERSVPAMREICAGSDRELVIPCRLPAAGQEPQATGPDPRVYLDPMIGFGTTREEDLELLRSIPELAKAGRVLVGASRKRIVKRLTGEKVPGKDLAGNLTIAVWAALNGASVVRVHDVAETVQALKVLSALREGIAG